MRRVPGPIGPRPGRILGLYALAVMNRDGPIYGYSFADLVAGRTDGAWRPGAGAVYPALQALVDRGFARQTMTGRRREYRITSEGRAFLARVRRGWAASGRSGPDMSRLWAEVAGESDPNLHLAGHLRRHLEGITAVLEKDPAARAGRGSLLELVRSELAAAQARLDALSGSDAAPSRPPRRRP